VFYTGANIRLRGGSSLVVQATGLTLVDGLRNIFQNSDK